MTKYRIVEVSPGKFVVEGWDSAGWVARLFGRDGEWCRLGHWSGVSGPNDPHRKWHASIYPSVDEAEKRIEEERAFEERLRQEEAFSPRIVREIG